MTEIRTERVHENRLKRGPGGHWYCYRAWRDSEPNKEGWGQTALEAAQDLEKRS